jgi:hypothetical protein
LLSFLWISLLRSVLILYSCPCVRILLWFLDISSISPLYLSCLWKPFFFPTFSFICYLFHNTLSAILILESSEIFLNNFVFLGILLHSPETLNIPYCFGNAGEFQSCQKQWCRNNDLLGVQHVSKLRNRLRLGYVKERSWAVISAVLGLNIIYWI